MSIRVMTLVWDRFPGAGSDLLAMQALADWCADDGANLYPSISLLAAKMRVSESQARRVLHGLIDEGFVSVIGNQFGGAPGTTREYRVNLAKLRALPIIPAIADHLERMELKNRPRSTGRTDATPPVDQTASADATPTGSTHARGSADARGSTGARDGSHGCKGTGSTHATQTVRLTVIEPSLNILAEENAEKSDFETAWSLFPKRAGGNNRRDAEKAWAARVKSGINPADIIAGVIRYAAFCKATEKLNTEFVKQAATFFGPAKHFSEPWIVPGGAGKGSGGPRRLDRSAAAAAIFPQGRKARQETIDV